MRTATVSVVACFGLAAAVVSPSSTARGGAVLDVPFTDVTASAGLAGVPVFRISVADVNGDGYPDLLLHTKPDEMAGDVVDKQFLFINEPGDVPGDPFSRKFVDRTVGSGIRSNRAGTGAGRHSSAAIFADADNDGDLDMFTGVYHHRNFTLNLGTNELLLNDGTGRFTLSPFSTFHNEPIYNTAAEVFLDFDNDGKIDVWTGNWYCPSTGAGDWCVAGLGTDGLTYDQLYRGQGNGAFANVTAAAGLRAAATVDYGIAAFDWNGDGFTDLFAPPYSHTSVYSTPRHWRNNGNGTFTQVQASTNYDDNRGFGSNVASFGSMPADYDNSGTIDFLEVLTHGGTSTGKYSGPVSNVAGVFSWDWTRVQSRGSEDPCTVHDGDHHAAWFDYDGDGLQDYALTESGYGSSCGGVDNNRVYLFRQGTDHRFSPVTAGSGLDDINLNNYAPGNVVPADFDLDGDEDLFVGLDTQGIRLYRNNVGNLNRWIAVTLEGVGGAGFSNKSAIGAKVMVTAGGITQTREVYAGAGHQGPQRPLSLTFGLGQAAVVDRIRVRWPNSTLTVSELTNVATNRFLEIREPCDYATDPSGLRVDKSGADLRLTWDDPGTLGWTWNVYRGPGPDASTWGAPHAIGVTDADPGTPGIQYQDVGATSGDSYYYLVTAVNHCGETPLR